MAADCQAGLQQLFEHRWATDVWFIAQLKVLLKDIVARNGLTAERWEEDGLGTQHGCCGRLPSGVVIVLVESTHLVSTGKVTGPALHADITDVGRVGIEDLLGEALAALGLTASDVAGRNIGPSVDEVEAWKRKAEEYRARRASAGTEN